MDVFIRVVIVYEPISAGLVLTGGTIFVNILNEKTTTGYRYMYIDHKGNRLPGFHPVLSFK